MDLPTWSIYLLLAVVALGWHLYSRYKKERRYLNVQLETEAAGLTEPPTLHPVINPSRCIGSGACADACPEQALGVVNGKAVLVNPSVCIGHGACLSACAFDAIQLVFGTERRGVDIPEVSPQFESNVPGLYIAGELGGMGLIRKAVEQGRQAIDHLQTRRASDGADLDLVIVGAGPAGLSAGLSATQHGLRFRLIEQESSLGGSVYHYPRHKIAMTAPVKLALVGTLKFSEVSKEKLLETWNGIVQKTGLPIHFRETMLSVERDGDGFVVTTNVGQYRARSVLLAIGRRGTPRKLDVPGEDAPKVVYALADPSQYKGLSVLVVGGGDSAVEAALAVSQEEGTQVQLSYRGQAFNRIKPKNRKYLDAAVAAGQLELLLSSTVERIEEHQVTLRQGDQIFSRPNDAVVVCAGGVLPIPLLQKMGIAFSTKHGEL
jgi:thioredoxin reductase/ferredoxin